MKFHHSFISWWLCSAVQCYNTFTPRQLSGWKRSAGFFSVLLISESSFLFVFSFESYHIWYFLFGSPSCSVGGTFWHFWVCFFLSFSLGRFVFWCFPFDISSVDFLFPFWSIFYLICLVTFYLICSHWRSGTYFILNTIIVLFQLWCHSPLWTLAPSRLQHHQTKSNFDFTEIQIILFWTRLFYCQTSIATTINSFLPVAWGFPHDVPGSGQHSIFSRWLCRPCNHI